MELKAYSDSQTYFEISAQSETFHFDSFRGRLLCVKDFLKKLSLLPLALVLKAYRTMLRAVGLCLSAVLLMVTFGGARAFFVERVGKLAKDLADWVLLPFAVGACFLRLLMGFFIHPSLYFNH